MNIIRKANTSELSTIYRMQNIEFRERVFIQPLNTEAEFVEIAEQRIRKGIEHYFVQESDGAVTGFICLLNRSDWEVVTWGKWLNTLLYATGIVSFETLRLPKVLFAVRTDNKRIMHLYKKHHFRNVGQEFICYRPNMLGPVKTTNLTHYEITADEFWERAEAMRKNSLLLTFV
jgi:hypothetical protein